MYFSVIDSRCSPTILLLKILINRLQGSKVSGWCLPAIESYTLFISRYRHILSFWRFPRYRSIVGTHVKNRLHTLQYFADFFATCFWQILKTGCTKEKGGIEYDAPPPSPHLSKIPKKYIKKGIKNWPRLSMYKICVVLVSNFWRRWPWSSQYISVLQGSIPYSDVYYSFVT